ncbi:dGTPase [Parachitinimonas caeni]|uniref:DGTPase n=1 Tax=Parachitinimonas caeni TaxID=3031301 RepID=A0ABT7E3U2_9NEIS|nr:dGTPase [Parachitinimonas caeni]MDK2126914.1 dGTPase [Parachitinimonas caeni]
MASQFQQFYVKTILGSRLCEDPVKGRNTHQEIESDRGRIVYSSALRRMQQKAQVFPLETNAAVRSRLTHTLEVSIVGRYLAQAVLTKAREKQLLDEHFDYAYCASFVSLVENACLIHDIGNPPFGHLGEAAISDWFRENGEAILRKLVNIDDIGNWLDDFYLFDGNPQGFRIVSRTQSKDGCGLNLTASQMAASIKYPYSSAQKREFAEMGRAGMATPAYSRKAGYFVSDAEAYHRVVKALGITEGRRYPLVYLMEAADDIAYCLSDIEDGIEKNLLTEDLFFDLLYRELKNEHSESEATRFVRHYTETRPNKSHSKPLGLTPFRTDLIRESIERAATTFVDNHSQIIAGEQIELLNAHTWVGEIHHALRAIATRVFVRSKEAENIEIAGYNIIHGILQKYARILGLKHHQFRALIDDDADAIREHRLDLEYRLCNRIPSKLQDCYRHATRHDDLTRAEEWHHRAHLIVDYVAGMTDNYALETYQLLHGIAVK